MEKQHVQERQVRPERGWQVIWLLYDISDVVFNGQIFYHEKKH